ncbi:MAG: cadmium-translocating P-type ATPase [Dehalococcoidia bacterium]|nr:cadmium-translocating P-type ATPase [Dehalococcoidia bacterium]MCB9507864.1 cadmium-translocating P-type ATPase [Myxococcales bacterium]
MATTRFRLPAMDCATEKAVIANRLHGMTGVEAMDFDLLERVVTVRHAEGVAPAVQSALAEIGMAPELLTNESPSPTRPGAREQALLAADDARWQGSLLVFSGLAATAAEVAALATGREHSLPIVALAIASMVTGGLRTLQKGLVAVRTFTLNMNLLMTIAIVGAAAIGQWPEAAMVTFLFALAELIEAKSADRARDAIRSLMALAPDVARVRRGEAWLDVDAASVEEAERVLVRPGERVPLDGTIVEGSTSIDQAPITGESVPVDRGKGDPVFAGTINQHGAIEIHVTADAGHSTLARIARTIRDAQSQSAPTQRFVDRFARYYTPTVVLLAIGVAALPSLVGGAAFEPWLYRALVLLVIACPCALVLSTPITVVSGLTAAARRGILIKGGAYLEAARDLRVIALDKTGTLTHGKPTLVDVEVLDGAARDDLLQRAASLEATSAHPIAHAVTEGWSGPLLEAVEVRATEGKGIEGVVAGRRLAIGSHRFAEERGVCGPEVEAILERLEGAGRSVMLVWDEDGALGVLGVADTLRDTSVEAVQRLHGRGIRLAMLTGDNPTTAAAMARDVGIDEVRAHLLPDGKLAAIDELAAKHGPVGMVGDGVNDAPALARAAIGFAMGAAGSDTALETADVALMKDDLRGVADLVDLSRRTATILRTNIALAIGIKAVFFGLAVAGLATLWMAIFADMGASLIVAANGLRLLGGGGRASP